MQKGLKNVVVDLMGMNPDGAAEDYAGMAPEQGPCGSDSKNPVFFFFKRY